MKKKNDLFVLFFVIILILPACSGNTEDRTKKDDISYENSRNTFLYNAIPSDTPAATITDSYKDGVNTFAVNLLGHLYDSSETGNNNIILCPFSVSRNLSVLAEGCSEAAKNELITALGGQPVLDDAKKALAELLYADDSVIFQSADTLYFDSNNFTLKTDFAETVKEKYGVNVQGLDFSDVDSSVSLINGWIADNTAGYINDYLKADDFDENTYGYIMNAVYFKAAWASPFDINATHTDTFHAPSGDVEVPMMVSDYKHQIFGNENFENAVVYYGNNDEDYFYLDIYMPAKGMSISNFITNHLLTALSLGKTNQYHNHYYGDLTMPKFDFTTDTDLSPFLKEMGVTKIFKTNDNPVSEMFQNTGDNYFWVKSVKQRAGIKTDEEGTVAYAVTVSETSGDTAAGPPDAIVLNRPFLYCIRAGSNGLVLFIGVVQNPLLE